MDYEEQIRRIAEKIYFKSGILEPKEAEEIAKVCVEEMAVFGMDMWNDGYNQGVRSETGRDTTTSTHALI